MPTEKMHSAELFNDLNEFTNQFLARKKKAELYGPMEENPYLNLAALTLQTALAQIRIICAQQTMHDYLTKKTGGIP